MKINENYIMRNIAGEVVILPTGEAAQYFNGMIATNQVAAFIWEHLEECETPDDMVKLVYDTFEAEEDIIRNDVVMFLNDLKKAGMIEF